MNTEENSKVFVHGISMHPLMRNGDIPQLHPVSREKIASGDIIVFRNQSGKNIIHRVIQTQPQLVTRGDNCAHDDPPVPQESPLWRVSGFTRNGKKHPLCGGSNGMRQHHRHQRRMRILLLLRRCGGKILEKNPFRYPAAKLKKVQFQQKIFYYFGKHPVGYYENKRWHWQMRFARFWIEKPQEKN